MHQNPYLSPKGSSEGNGFWTLMLLIAFLNVGIGGGLLAAAFLL